MPSVRPSVCLSLFPPPLKLRPYGGIEMCVLLLLPVRHTRVLWQNEQKFWRHSYTIWKENSSTFSDTQEWLVGDAPFYLKFWIKLTHPASKTAIFHRYSLVPPQALHLVKKVKLWLIWTQYELSNEPKMNNLRWPEAPKGGWKTQIGHFFHLKMYVSGRKSAAKFLCVKTVSGKVVRHSLAYLSVHKWLVGDIPFYLKFSTKVTHPLQKRRFSIDIRS